MNVNWHSDYGEVPTAIKVAVEEAIARSRILGVCLGISLEGRRYFLSAGRSLADSTDSIPIDTRYKLGCLSKVVGAAAVLEMCGTKLLDLNAPIGRYLPELANHTKGDKITVSHLISHTPGYQAINTIDPGGRSSARDSFYESVRDAEQLFEPGHVFSYQNSAAALLGEIVLRKTGTTLLRMIEASLHAPRSEESDVRSANDLQAREVIGHLWSRSENRFVRCERGHEIDDLLQPAMCSRLSMSVSEFLPLAENLVGPVGVGLPPTGQFSQMTVEKMREQVVSIPRGSEGAAAGSVPVGYGHGLGRYARGLLGHDSSMPGEATGFRVLPGADCAIVVGLNSDRWSARQEIFDAVADALSIPEMPPSALPLQFALDELEGIYMGREKLTVDVSRMGREILLSMGYETKGLVKMLGTVDSTGYFQPRKSAGVKTDLRERICYTFFRDPLAGTPCLMMGVTALRRMA